MEGQRSDSLPRPGPPPQDTFAFNSRQAGFPLLAHPPSINLPAVPQHNTALHCPSPNLSPKVDSNPNSSFVVSNIHLNAVTEPNQSSPAFYSADSPSAATPAAQLTPKVHDGSSSETRIKKRVRPQQYVNDEDAPTVDFPKPPTPMPQKKRGPGGGKKGQLHALGLEGQNFTLHVITVLIGQDVCTKIMNFLCQGPWSICILSASGTISNAAIRHSGVSGGAVAYEGHFEILSLSGSFLVTEDNIARRTGGLSISLAGPDGRVIGGGVVGLLMAATPVQVVVGTFSTEGCNTAGSGEGSWGMKTAARTGAGTQPSISQLNNHNLVRTMDGAMGQSVRHCVSLPLMQSLAWGGHQFSTDTGDDTNHATSTHET